MAANYRPEVRKEIEMAANFTGTANVANRAKLRSLLAPIATDEYFSKILFQAVTKGQTGYLAEVERGETRFEDLADDLGEMAYILLELGKPWVSMAPSRKDGKQ